MSPLLVLTGQLRPVQAACGAEVRRTGLGQGDGDVGGLNLVEPNGGDPAVDRLVPGGALTFILRGGREAANIQANSRVIRENPRQMRFDDVILGRRSIR